MAIRRTYFILLTLCLAVVVLGLLGGFAANIQISKQDLSASGQYPITPLPLVTGTITTVVWFWGLVITGKQQRWGWFIVVLLTSFIGASIFAISNIIKPWAPTRTFSSLPQAEN